MQKARNLEVSLNHTYNYEVEREYTEVKYIADSNTGIKPRDLSLDGEYSKERQFFIDVLDFVTLKERVSDSMLNEALVSEVTALQRYWISSRSLALFHL